VRNKILLIAAILVVAAALVFAAVPFFVRRAAVKSLSGIFPGSTVSVGRGVWVAGGLALEDVKIERAPLYRLQAGRIAVSVAPGSLMRGMLDRCVVERADISLTIPRTLIARVAALVSLPAGKSAQAPLLRELSVSSLRADVRAKDMRLQAEVSCAVDLPAARLERLDAAIGNFEGWNVFLQDARIAVGQGADGSCSVARGRVMKLRFSDLQAAASLKDDTLVFSGMLLRLLQGEMRGEVRVALRPPFAYEAALEAQALSLAEFVKDFELEKSMSMEGVLSGPLGIKGDVSGLPVFSGGLTAQAPGGRVRVMDEATLEAVERSSDSRSGVAQAVGSFKDFPFDLGTLTALAQEGDLTLQFTFKGPQGRIDFPIVYHVVTQSEGGEGK
jgi:hypothetical protein